MEVVRVILTPELKIRGDSAVLNVYIGDLQRSIVIETFSKLFKRIGAVCPDDK